MKRSEMVELMVKAYCAYSGPLIDHQFKMKRVLEAMEKAGMQPPPHQEEYGTGYPDEYGHEITDVQWVQGWEQEEPERSGAV
jgi:hypothetical protein